jgi:predicted nucleic acid-binding protein
MAEPLENWVSSLGRSPADVCVPEVAYYELRRELVRLRNLTATRRLDSLTQVLAYAPITKNVIILASELWAEARRRGKPTADDKALDIDVLLAATALDLAKNGAEAIVATTNVGHLTRFVPASLWTDIKP